MSALFRILIPLLLFAISYSSCTDIEDNINTDSIIGEWQHTQRVFSAGGDLIVEDVIGGEVYRIDGDGTFTYIFEEEFTGTWEVTTDDVLSFSFEVVVEGHISDFTFEVDGDDLILKPAFVFCTEECFNKYERR